jgi:hypothetical protein
MVPKTIPSESKGIGSREREGVGPRKSEEISESMYSCPCECQHKEWTDKRHASAEWKQSADIPTPALIVEYDGQDIMSSSDPSCYTVVFESNAEYPSASELRSSLEKGSDEVKLDTLRKIIISTINGNPQASYLLGLSLVYIP